MRTISLSQYLIPRLIRVSQPNAGRLGLNYFVQATTLLTHFCFFKYFSLFQIFQINNLMCFRIIFFNPNTPILKYICIGRIGLSILIFQNQGPVPPISGATYRYIRLEQVFEDKESFWSDHQLELRSGLGCVIESDKLNTFCG